MGASLFLRIAGEKTLHAQIEILASLQTVDREIKEQNSIKQELLGELQTKDQEIEAKKREIAVLTASYSEKEKLRQEKDRVLQEEGKKTVDRRMRMSRIKNVKELQALQREIEQIKQNNGELEEELIKIMEEVDGFKAAIKSKEEELGKIRDEWRQKQESMRAQISGIDQAVSEAATRRQTIASQVTGDLISRYELIFSRRGGTAVVEVAGGICRGCYMNIPPQLWNEIIRSEKVHLCPSCQRILYYKAPVEQEKSV
jgi:predicted  nucleic acid-binding Zn-ribbon protein